MEVPRFAVECPGEPCPLHHKPETHSHMPAQEKLPNRLEVSQDAQALAELILRSYTGLAGDERDAHIDDTFQEMVREMNSEELVVPQPETVS